MKKLKTNERGEQSQVCAGLGFGPDGLYFAPMLPDKEGVTVVLKLTYEPESSYPFMLGSESNPIVLMNTHGCLACHALNGRGGGVGPILDRDLLVPRLRKRLNTTEYRQAVQEVDLLDGEPFDSFQEARHSVDQASGIDKINTWLGYRNLDARL